MPPPAANPAVVPAAPRSPYRRLPGRVSQLGASFVRRTSVLWLGADELVQVDTVFWTEKIRRFAYADIQALLLRETPRGWIVSLVCGGLAALFGLLAWTTENPAGRGFLAVLAMFFAVTLIYNAVRGGTCSCTLLTALGPQALPSLSRRRPARKALRVLTDRVLAAQGGGTP